MSSAEASDDEITDEDKRKATSKKRRKNPNRKGSKKPNESGKKRKQKNRMPQINYMHTLTESMAKRFHGFLAGEKSTGWRR